MDKYKAILESLRSRVASGELTVEEAENINVLAWKKYGVTTEAELTPTINHEMGDVKAGILGDFQKKAEIDDRNNPVNVENHDKTTRGANGTGDVAPKKSIEAIVKAGHANGKDEITSGTPTKLPIGKVVKDKSSNDVGHFNDTESSDDILSEEEMEEAVRLLNSLRENIYEAAMADIIPAEVVLAFDEAVETAFETDDDEFTESVNEDDEEDAEETMEAFIDVMNECIDSGYLTEENVDTLKILLDDDKFITSLVNKF